jgi:hypothetical protein
MNGPCGLPDQIVVNEIEAWPNVFMDINSWFHAVHTKFPWIKPLPTERRGDIAWEMAGFHFSGCCVSVRCVMDHQHGMARDPNQSLNTYFKDHLTEEKGKCIKGFWWHVLTRTEPMSHGGVVKWHKKVAVEALSTMPQVLAELCQVITNMFVGFKEDDAMLDDEPVCQEQRPRPTLHEFGAQENDAMDI